MTDSLVREQTKIVIAIGIIAATFSLRNTVNNLIPKFREDAIISPNFMIVSLAIPWGVYLLLLGISFATRSRNYRRFSRLWNGFLGNISLGARTAYDLAAILTLALPVFYGILIGLEVNDIPAGERIDEALSYAIEKILLVPSTSFALILFLAVVTGISLILGILRYRPKAFVEF